MRVALTFDDGPSEWTEPILDLLSPDAHATFFVCGHAIPGNEPLLRRMVAEGHEIGNHGYSHKRLTTLTREEVAREIGDTTDLIVGATGTPVKWWRAPHFDREGIDVGLRHVGATLDTNDWALDTTGIVQRVENGVFDGCVVDLHDGIPPDGGTGQKTRQPTVDAVEQILWMNLELVTLTELAAEPAWT